jgi:hypothetical protein
MEQKFWFKYIMTESSFELPVNIDWTLAEFLTKVKSMINDGSNIKILDNFSDLREDNPLRECIIPEECTLREKYRNKICDLAFYIRRRVRE